MTVNHGVLGSSPCSGAIARGLQERCRSGVDSTSVERSKSCSPKPFFGSLAQLVQSICLTSRGSAVRIRQLPLKKRHRKMSLFFVCVQPLRTSPQSAYKQKNKRIRLLLLERVLTDFELGGAVTSSAIAHQAMLDCTASSVMTRSSESPCATFESVAPQNSKPQLQNQPPQPLFRRKYLLK